MLLGEYSVRTGKTPQQHKSTYTTYTTGEVNPAQQAAIWSRSHWSGAGQTRLTRPADRSEQRRMVGGGGGQCLYCL